MQSMGRTLGNAKSCRLSGLGVLGLGVLALGVLGVGVLGVRVLGGLRCRDFGFGFRFKDY